MSQNQAILAHLQSGRTLTPGESLTLHNCWALSSRISELRRQGWPIESELVKLSNGKLVARYSLAEERIAYG